MKTKTKTKSSKNPIVVQLQFQTPKTKNVVMSPCGSFLSFETNWVGNQYSPGFIYNTNEGLVYVDPGYLQKTYKNIDALLWDYELQELKPYWKPTALTQVPSFDFHSENCEDDVRSFISMIF